MKAAEACKIPKFQAYMVSLLKGKYPNVSHETCEQTARNTVHRTCKTKTIAQFNDLDDAKGIFMELMRKYNIWADSQ